MSEPIYRSAFVPHDLKTPVKGAADGPLAGLTAAVKDMYDIAGTITGNGNPTWLETHAPATRHSAAVQKILDAGATVIGKTVCDEFFYSVTGANAHYGTPLNPRAAGRLPGGSSSGSASAVASGACDFALGSDTGGSVRIPASFNGIYGLRPTLGRVDANRRAPRWRPRSTRPAGSPLGRGCCARSAASCWTAAASQPRLERVIVLEDAFEQADDDVADLVKTALELMSDDLPLMQHGRIAPDGFDPWREAFRVVQAFETWQSFGDFVRTHRPEPGPRHPGEA